MYARVISGSLVNRESESTDKRQRNVYKHIDKLVKKEQFRIWGKYNCSKIQVGHL